MLSMSNNFVEFYIIGGMKPDPKPLTIVKAFSFPLPHPLNVLSFLPKWWNCSQKMQNDFFLRIIEIFFRWTSIFEINAKQKGNLKCYFLKFDFFFHFFNLQHLLRIFIRYLMLQLVWKWSVHSPLSSSAKIFKRNFYAIWSDIPQCVTYLVPPPQC